MLAEIKQMKIYKRSELTPDIIRQWEYDAQFDLVYISAPSVFDLSMAISDDSEGGKVDLRKDGDVLIDGYPAGRWRKMGEEFQFYIPGNGALSGKVIRTQRD